MPRRARRFASWIATKTAKLRFANCSLRAVIVASAREDLRADGARKVVPTDRNDVAAAPKVTTVRREHDVLKALLTVRRDAVPARTATTARAVGARNEVMARRRWTAFSTEFLNRTRTGTTDSAKTKRRSV